MWVSTVSILIFIIYTFAQVYINLVDQYQEGYNSSYGTYGAASSLRQNGEVDFNFKDYDNFFNNFYRVRVNSVGKQSWIKTNLNLLNKYLIFWFWFQTQIHLLDTNDPPNIYQTPEGEYVTFTVKAPLVSQHIRSPPEEPHLAWVDVTFLGDFSCLSWASIICNQA